MRPGRIVALVIGVLLVLPGLGLLFGGGVLAAAYGTARDDAGFFEASLDRLSTDGVAIATDGFTFGAEPGSPDWVVDALDADVRLRVTSPSGEQALFVGIAPEADLDRYLAGSAHDEVADLDQGRSPRYRHRPGTAEIAPPGDQTFWEASASGAGTQELIWEATSGRWAAVVMAVDGSAGVVADVDVGLKADIVLPVALGLLGAGLVLIVVGVILVIVGARGSGEHATIATVEPGIAGTPVAVHAELDPDLSRWQWLVKWFLAIPHLVVLAFLWVALVVLTVVAGVAILITGRYPRGIFDFNVGVLRWSWRVSYYALHGGIGTDRYPPFSLGPDTGYPATLDIAYPERLSKGLVLVKWWLLALPHYLVVAILLGTASDADRGTGTIGLLSVLVVVAGVLLLVKERYPRALFDLIVGLNRWIFRVAAYALLMTDEYPPFRLDQGGDEPASSLAPPPAPPDRTPMP